jgi:hypothetical protein
VAHSPDHAEPERAAEPQVAGPVPEGAPAAAIADHAALGVARILALQRSAGNAAVSRMLLQRDGVPDADTYHRERAARDTYIAGGVRGPEDFRASTGRGGFQVAYIADMGAMNVTLKGGVDFQDGIRMVGQNAVAVQPSQQVANAVGVINSKPADQRAALVAPWQWSDADRTGFLAAFESQVEAAWHRRYEFHCSKQYWEDLGSVVNVFVEVHAGANNTADHMRLTTYKIAPNAPAGGVGVVNSPAGTGAAASHGNRMTLNSTDVGARSDIRLTSTGTFTAGTTTLAADGSAAVQYFGTRFQSQGGPRCATCGQEIAGMAGTIRHARVQGSGADPQANARDRFNVITTALVGAGMADAATGGVVFEYAGVGDKLDLVVGGGAQQVVAAHEAGHMFGLGDEYTNPFGGTGAAPGSAVDGTLGPNQGLPGAVSENNDSIMSVGNAVKPQHYATFLEALKHVSGMQEWAFGPPNGVLPPGVDGPLPQPGQQPGQQPSQPPTAVA